MIFLIVEDLLLTTNIEELRENSDRPTTTKDGEYCTLSDSVPASHFMINFTFRVRCKSFCCHFSRR